MVLSDLVAPLTQYVLGVLGGVAAALLFKILQALDREDALQVFTEDQDATTKDFEHLTWAAVLMFTAFAFFTVGAYYENTTLTAVSRLVEVAFFIVMVTIFYGWWGRFR